MFNDAAARSVKVRITPLTVSHQIAASTIIKVDLCLSHGHSCKTPSTLVSPLQMQTSKREMAALPPIALDPLRPSRPMYDIPEGLRFDERLVVPGTTGEAVIQLDTAVWIA